MLRKRKKKLQSVCVCLLPEKCFAPYPPSIPVQQTGLNHHHHHQQTVCTENVQPNPIFHCPPSASIVRRLSSSHGVGFVTAISSELHPRHPLHWRRKGMQRPPSISDFDPCTHRGANVCVRKEGSECSAVLRRIRLTLHCSSSSAPTPHLQFRVNK